MFCMLKNKKFILLIFQNIIQSVNKKILLMVPNGEGWHYLAVKKLSGLIRGIKSKNNGDFYCLNCLYSFRTKDKLKAHNKYLKINNF